MKVANKTIRRKVDPSSNNNLKITFSNFAKSNVNQRDDNLELQDEHLDFEPEDEFISNLSEEEQNQFENNYDSTYSFSRDNSSIDDSDQFSTDSQKVSRNSIHNSINQNNDKMSILSKLTNYSTNDSLSSIPHKEDQLPYYFDRAEDGRKKDYLRYIPQSITVQTTIDSSSSSKSSSITFDDNEMEEDGDRYTSKTGYDINSDEENRLLESDEIEAEEIAAEEIENTDDLNYSEHSETSSEDDLIDQQPVFCDKSLRTSGYNIIIKTIQNYKKIVLQRNARRKKRTRLIAIDKKWQIHCELKDNIRLFLKDIGYIPSLRRISESNSSSGSESATFVTKSSQISSPSMTSFQITLNSMQSGEKRNCKQVKKCGSQISAFKVPLPPIKRPPTRPKRTSSTSSNETILSRLGEKSMKTIEDDVISISASSIDHLDRDLDQDFSDSIKEETLSDYQYQINNSGSILNKSYVENWVSTQPHITIPPSPPSPKFIPPLLSTPITPPSLNSDSTVRITSAISGGGVRINFNDVPKFFSGVCFHYYFNEHCVKQNCLLPHYVKEHSFLNKSKELSSPEELQKLYAHSVRFHLLFQDMYPVFLKAFAYFKMQNDLISCIEHFFDLKEKIDINVALERVIDALQDTGLTFLETIEKISFSVGFLRYPDLANMLLDILTSRCNVCDNWEVIKRICRATNSISPRLFERILSKLLLIETPNSKDLCKDIYNVIVKNNLTDLSLVDPHLLNPIKTLAKFGDKSLSNAIAKNLSIERERFERSVQNTDCQFSDLDSEHIKATDSDERLNLIPNHSSKINHRQEVCSRASSRSSKSSDAGGNSTSTYSLKGWNDYQYKPQSASADQTSVQSSGTFTVTFPSMADNSQHPPPIPARVVMHSAPNISSVYPDAPIFGKFKYNQNVFSEQSLHNLLPLNPHQVSMNETHIVELINCIGNKNGIGFLRILDLYKSPSTIQHFVTMCVAEIKSCRKPCDGFLDLVENIGMVEPNFKKIPLLKGVLEVITFNMLLVFERKCQWVNARRLVEVFNDWDSLITSKQFGAKLLTAMGKYILLAKLLTKSGAFYYAYEILQSPDLNLLDSPNRWPLFKAAKIDLESRNEVLTDFFKYAFRQNVEVVCDIYRRIFQFGNIYQFDAYSYFNPMLEYLINNEKSLLLKHIHSNIEIFYPRMERNIFRAFTIFMENNLSMEHKMKLYEYGCKKGIYVQFTGKEQTVVVRTNMPDNEIKLILQSYFNALSHLPRYEINHNLIIEIKLPDGIVQSPQILHRCLRSIFELNNSVKKLVNECFLLQIFSPNLENNTVLQIPKEELRQLARF